jgi:hypothetical protein
MSLERNAARFPFFAASVTCPVYAASTRVLASTGHGGGCGVVVHLYLMHLSLVTIVGLRCLGIV